MDAKYKTRRILLNHLRVEEENCNGDPLIVELKWNKKKTIGNESFFYEIQLLIKCFSLSILKLYIFIIVYIYFFFWKCEMWSHSYYAYLPVSLPFLYRILHKIIIYKYYQPSLGLWQKKRKKNVKCIWKEI